MMTETEMRQQGFDEWNKVERCFIWNQLSLDFQRQIVEYDTTYKTQLEHYLLAAFHQYATYPSYFYKNMFVYIQNKLCEQKQLIYYLDKVKELYWNKHEEEMAATRHVYKYVDGNGRIIDSYIC